MAFRPATGRKITVEKNPITVRALMRRHLREHGKTIGNDLAGWWNVKYNSAYRIMYRPDSPLSPQYISAFVDGIGLDEFDATELYLRGAIEAGYAIKLNRIKV